jgi:hypothetical protein
MTTTTTALKLFVGTLAVLMLVFGTPASAYWQGPAVHTVAPGFLDGFVQAGSVGGDGTYPTVYLDGVAAGQVGADGHFWLTVAPGHHTLTLSHTFGAGEQVQTTVVSGRVSQVVFLGEAHPTFAAAPVAAKVEHIVSAYYQPALENPNNPTGFGVELNDANNHGVLDVTAQVRENVGQTINASNDFFNNDPAYGWYKELVVVYGDGHQTVTAENDDVLVA